MTYDEAVSLYEQGGAFNLINLASEEVRPDTVLEWFGYEAYRSTYATAWAAMMGDKAVAFEEESPLDGLAYGAFLEGWNVALRRVGSMLGINPDVFRAAIDFAGEQELQLLPEQDIVRLQSVLPLESHQNDVGRYYDDIEAALLGAYALCARVG